MAAFHIDVDLKLVPDDDALMLSFHHLDLVAQALAKIERGHRQDVEDADDAGQGAGHTGRPSRGVRRD